MEAPERAVTEAAVAERLLDLLEKAERRGRFDLPQTELLREIADDFGIALSRVEAMVDRLVGTGGVGRASAFRGPVLYRPPGNPERIARGLLRVLFGAQREGHAALPLGSLLARTAKILRSDVSILESGLDALVAETVLIKEAVGAETLVYSASAYSVERAMVTRLMALTTAPLRKTPRARRIARIVAHAEKRSGLALNDEQRKAVEVVLRHPVSLITGAPGTGKTTVIRAAVASLARVSGGRPVLLAAPTGKAARRLSEATGQPACTIHRLLHYAPALDGFARDQCNPLDATAVIVDEASMIDLTLMADLLAAIPRNCRLVFVGDPDQLPPVAFGQPFADMLASGRLPVARLEKVLRQTEGSAIAAACRAIRDGRLPDFPPYATGSEISLVNSAGPAFPSVIMNVVKEIAPEIDDPFTGLQILAPMKDKAGGIHALNELLAPIGNPLSDLPGPSCRLLGGTGRCGDKIQQMRNNYEKGVANGDQGRLLGISEDPSGDKRILALFGNSAILYTAAEAAVELALAYAITIHRSQGSEWQVVIVCLPGHARHMLTRNLLYTALSRGKRRVIVVGPADMIGQAIRTQGSNRQGGVQERLRKLLGGRRPPERRRLRRTLDNMHPAYHPSCGDGVTCHYQSSRGRSEYADGDRSRANRN